MAEQHRPEYFSRVDFVASRIERYGLATIILIALFFWAKPHIDALITDHRAFLKSTEETQAKQAEILSGNNGALTRIERNQERSDELIRDIHGKLIQRRVVGGTLPEKSQEQKE